MSMRGLKSKASRFFKPLADAGSAHIDADLENLPEYDTYDPLAGDIEDENVTSNIPLREGKKLSKKSSCLRLPISTKSTSSFPSPPGSDTTIRPSLRQKASAFLRLPSSSKLSKTELKISIPYPEYQSMTSVLTSYDMTIVPNTQTGDSVTGKKIPPPRPERPESLDSDTLSFMRESTTRMMMTHLDSNSDPSTANTPVSETSGHENGSVHHHSRQSSALSACVSSSPGSGARASPFVPAETESCHVRGRHAPVTEAGPEIPTFDAAFAEDKIATIDFQPQPGSPSTPLTDLNYPIQPQPRAESTNSSPSDVPGSEIYDPNKPEWKVVRRSKGNGAPSVLWQDESGFLHLVPDI